MNPATAAAAPRTKVTPTLTRSPAEGALLGVAVPLDLAVEEGLVALVLVALPLGATKGPRRPPCGCAGVVTFFVLAAAALYAAKVFAPGLSQRMCQPL